MAEKIRMLPQFCYIYVKNLKSTTHNIDAGMDRINAWQKAYEWFAENATDNKEIMLEFCQVKLFSRILLYAQDYSWKLPTKKALVEEMKRINGYDVLMRIKSGQVLPYQREMLLLFQQKLGKFIFLNWIRGLKIYWGRVALRFTPIKNWRDKKVYPFERISVDGPVTLTKKI